LHGVDDRGQVLVREVLRRSFDVVGRGSFPLHDPLAVAIAEDPEIAVMREGGVRVDVGEHLRGATRLATGLESDRVANVADRIDVARFFSSFARLCPLDGALT
jgi:inosine-uridine nucleoside N-ribohydrolase